jgi:hypothetical protein
VIGDKGYYGRQFEADLAGAGIQLLRPARKGEPTPTGERFFKPLRQVIESINDTLKGQLDLEAHGGRTMAGVCARVAQRILALTAVIWHNDRLGLPIRRSLTAYDQITHLGGKHHEQLPTGLPPESWRISLSRDRLVGGVVLVVDRAHQLDAAVTSAVIVEVVAPGQDDLAGMVGIGELVPRQDFPFQAGEERLRGGIVETGSDPAHGLNYA